MFETGCRRGIGFVWRKLPHKGWYVAFRLAMCCATAWLPLVSGWTVDLIATPGFPFWKLCFYASLGIAIEMLSYAAGTAIGYFWQRCTQRASADIQKALWRRAQEISAQRWDSKAPGLWMSRIGSDAGVVMGTLQSLMDFAVGTSVSFLFASAVILRKVPLLWVALLGFAAVQFLSYRAWRPRFRHMAKRQRELGYRSGEVVYDLVGMTALFKCFGVAHLFFPLYDSLQDRTVRRSLASARLGIRYNTLMQAEVWGVRLFVLALCLWLYARGVITLGDIVVYGMYVGQLIGISMSVTGILPSLEQGRESAAALTELLGWCDEGAKEGVARQGGARIAAQKLSFRYEDSAQAVIRDFTAEIPPKSFVCFVGRNGSGKSTLVKLLMGVYAPTSGKVTALSACAFVPQRNAVYNDTFLENVRLRDKSISEARVAEAVRLCGLGAFMERHPLGSKLRPDTLSGGELQLLGLARAMVRRPEVLLLDEPNNNLDIVARERLADVLETLRHACTLVIVTHDLRATRMADRVFLFCDGTIQEVDGSPEEREAKALALLRRQ